MPRTGHPNSGLQAMHFATKFDDEVWAIPEVGDPLGGARRMRISLFDRGWLKRLLPIRVVRALFLVEAFMRALFRPEATFFVHSFLFAVPFFLLRRRYCIFIHGSDRRHLHKSWARPIVRKAVRVFGVGFAERIGDHQVEAVPNLFKPAEIHEPVPRRFDVIFVLRNAEVKNPLYPIVLAESLIGRKPRIAVVGMGEGELDYAASARVVKVREAGAVIEYFGRRSYEEVIAIMASSGFLLIPSHSEGVPKVMLEALAQGIRVLMNRTIQVPAGLERCVESVDLADWHRLGVVLDEESDALRDEARISHVMRYLADAEKRLHDVQLGVYSTPDLAARG